MSTDFDEMQKELLETFLEEAQDHCMHLQESLSALEEKPGDASIIDELFRRFHNLKGSAGAVNLKKVVEITHVVESILTFVKNDHKPLQETEVTLVLQSVGVLLEIIDTVRQTKSETGKNYYRLLADLDEVCTVMASKSQQEEQEASQQKTASRKDGTQYLRVASDNVENLLASVGELLVVKNRYLMMTERWKDSPDFLASVRDLELVTDEIQKRISKLRLSPIRPLLQSMHGVVRSAASLCNKSVKLSIDENKISIDRSVLEKLNEPLVHIIRNAIDHGLEDADQRELERKDPRGKISISAYHRSGKIELVISDDGRGIDPKAIGASAVKKGIISQEQIQKMTEREIINLIFSSGFSTRDEVSEISGRGYGMDIVKTTIEQVRGSIQIKSKLGYGTTFQISLPLSMSIIDSLFFRVGSSSYSIPISQVDEVFLAQSKRDQMIQNDGMNFVKIRDVPYPVLSMGEYFGEARGEEEALILVNSQNLSFVLAIDHIERPGPAYIQSIPDSDAVEGPFSGVSKAVDGSVILQLDIHALSASFQPCEDSYVGNDTIAQSLQTEVFLSDLKRLNQKVILFSNVENFALPIQRAENILYVRDSDIHRMRSQKQRLDTFVTVDDQTIPLIWVEELLLSKDRTVQDVYWVVTIQVNEEIFGVPMADFLGIERLPMHYKPSHFDEAVIGTTVVDGASYLVLDPIELIERAINRTACDTNRFKHSDDFHVLVAEDEPFYRSHLVSLLQQYEVKVTEAEDGEKAIQQLEKSDFLVDAIVTDIEMPHADGIKLIKWLRSQKTYEKTPIIVLSALTTQKVIDTALAAGADHFLSKMDHKQLIGDLKKVALGQSIAPDQEENSVMDRSKVVTFQVGSEHCALPMGIIKEVASYKKPTQLPNSSELIEGLTNYKGDIIPIVNLSAALNRDSTRSAELKVRIIVDAGEALLGLSVSRIDQVYDLRDLQVGEGVVDSLRSRSKLIKNVLCHGKKNIFLLNSQELVSLMNPGRVA